MGPLSNGLFEQNPSWFGGPNQGEPFVHHSVATVDGREHFVVNENDPRIAEAVGSTSNRDRFIAFLTSGGWEKIGWRGLQGVRILAGGSSHE